VVTPRFRRGLKLSAATGSVAFLDVRVIAVPPGSVQLPKSRLAVAILSRPA